MTEQELIDTIGKLLDEELAKGKAFALKDIARAAIERCGAARVSLEAVVDLVSQVFTYKFEPWNVLPGTKPRLKEWGDGVARLTHKPTVLEILEAGRQAGEPLEVTLARANPTGDEIDAYMAWLRNRAEKAHAQARELKRELASRTA
jgi:hypothetical protein